MKNEVHRDSHANFAPLQCFSFPKENLLIETLTEWTHSKQKLLKTEESTYTVQWSLPPCPHCLSLACALGTYRFQS